MKCRIRHVQQWGPTRLALCDGGRGGRGTATHAGHVEPERGEGLVAGNACVVHRNPATELKVRRRLIDLKGYFGRFETPTQERMHD